MVKYKITISEDKVGYRIVLWKRFIVFYIPDTISTFVSGNRDWAFDKLFQLMRQYNISKQNVKGYETLQVG